MAHEALLHRDLPNLWQFRHELLCATRRFQLLVHFGSGSWWHLDWEEFQITLAWISAEVWGVSVSWFFLLIDSSGGQLVKYFGLRAPFRKAVPMGSSRA